MVNGTLTRSSKDNKMTHRITLDVPATGLQYGIPYVTSDESNATTIISNVGDSLTSWSGIEITHGREPGEVGAATVGVYKQSDNSLVAENPTDGVIYLYYPNNSEYSNANLTSNQGICEWNTYYYIDVVPNTPSERREQIAIRKLTTTITLNS
jgi:hypothetical protein